MDCVSVPFGAGVGRIHDITLSGHHEPVKGCLAYSKYATYAQRPPTEAEGHLASDGDSVATLPSAESKSVRTEVWNYQSS